MSVKKSKTYDLLQRKKKSISIKKWLKIVIDDEFENRDRNGTFRVQVQR